MPPTNRTPQNLTQRLFRNPSGQEEMFDKSVEEELEDQEEAVECLGKRFANDTARREYYLAELAQKLRDPEFRKIEGFPIGSDEAILALSDPPYYTACPNPFADAFINHHSNPDDPSTPYGREPFAADVSEGKNDSIYNAHSYHTKVPHKAIMRYILHYTKPGDLVFDGFSGTGMTGVASQLCGDPTAVTSLGLTVAGSGDICNAAGERVSSLGARRVILSDLSPFASFITSRYNDFDSSRYSRGDALAFIRELAASLLQYYETRDPQTNTRGHIRYAVWSEMFSCPHCSYETSLFAFAVDQQSYQLKDTFPCPSCAAALTKDELTRSWATRLDIDGESMLREAKTVLTEIVAEIEGSTSRFTPIAHDLARLRAAEAAQFEWFPTDAFPHGRQTRKVLSGSGIARVHQMFTSRNLLLVSHSWAKALSRNSVRSRLDLLFLTSAVLTMASRRERYRDGTGKGSQSGTLYVPSLQIEKNVLDALERKRRSFAGLDLHTNRNNACVTCQSHSDLQNIPADSIDYIFTDPPFGESLQYGELNFFSEAWLQVFTKLDRDCVLNYVHKKDLAFYENVMRAAFTEAFRILKPGRWITVEFHNSQNSVWSAIQRALWHAKFAVADVRVLDKQQSTYNVVNRAGAVKKDLVISAYKPSDKVEEQFRLVAGSEEGAWSFVRAHLDNLPVFVLCGKKIEIVSERQKYLLFDRMVAFHIERGVTVPMSAADFYEGLAQRFPERDEMYFLPHQVGEYDRKRTSISEVEQATLFVCDESSAIEWLKRQLNDKPQSFRDLHPQFLQEIGGWQKHEEPLELLGLLQQNFLCYLGEGEVPSQVHSYLSTNFKDLRNRAKNDPVLIEKARDRWFVPDPKRASDLERIRERALLQEFDRYQHVSSKQLRVFRIEAIRAGFRKAWRDSDYATIIAIAAKLPEEILDEDPMLLMWYTNSLTRAGRQS